MVINGTGLTSRGRPPIVGMLDQKHRLHGVSYGLSEAGYDIRLKQDILFTPKYGYYYDPIFETTNTGLKRIQATQNTIITVNGDGKLASNVSKKIGRFVLASAMEEFDMPNDLVGVVHDKSTWARQGVSVFNTVIEPGWKGFLTLEIVFHGQERVRLPAGAGIAQVLFHKLSEPAEYSGKYQNQADKPVESKWEK